MYRGRGKITEVVNLIGFSMLGLNTWILAFRFGWHERSIAFF